MNKEYPWLNIARRGGQRKMRRPRPPRKPRGQLVDGSHGLCDRLEMILADKYFGSEPVPIPGVVLVAASWATVGAELFLALAVWVPRLRLPGLLVACGLHAAFYLLLPVGTFSVTTLALWIAVFPAAEVHRAVDRIFAD